MNGEYALFALPYGYFWVYKRSTHTRLNEHLSRSWHKIKNSNDIGLNCNIDAK